jgi:membrane AbrB-like protein
MSARQFVRPVAGLSVGLAGGALFTLINSPLPWMLGSLSATAAVSIAGADIGLPSIFRRLTRPVVGVLAGSAFTLPVVLTLANTWEIIPFLVTFLVAITLAGYVFFTRVCGFDPATAYFASTPGGLSELSLLGGLYGANMPRLVVVHSMRLVAVAFLVPFTVQFMASGAAPLGSGPIPSGPDGLTAIDWLLLGGCMVVGYWLAQFLNSASGTMLVPLLLSAGIHVVGLTEHAPPGWLIALMQVAIGTICGARFAGLNWQEFRGAILVGCIWAVCMLGAACLMAMLASAVVRVPLSALLLAFAPGGFAEITVVAFAVGIDVAFVICCQVFRSIALVTFVPLGIRFFAEPLERSTGRASS